MRYFFMLFFLAGCSSEPSALDKLKAKMDAGSTTISNPPKEGALERLLREQKESELEPLQPTLGSSNTSNTIITIVKVGAPPSSTIEVEQSAPTPVVLAEPKLSVRDFKLAMVSKWPDGDKIAIFNEKNGSRSYRCVEGSLLGDRGGYVKEISTENSTATLVEDGHEVVLRMWW